MTQFLPPNLLALFAPRDPIPFLAQLEKLPHEKHHNQPYSGIAPFIRHFEDPRDAPPPTRAETRDERLERKRREKIERRQTVVETELKLWDPHNDPNAQGDAFKTLFVARVNYDTTESKLRREFEVYGPIKRIYIVYNKRTSKPRGYAFIEYEHERDMHSAYKHADGKKIDGRRVLVDVERGRTVKGWQPRRLGGGLGGTRRGGADVNIKHSGRDDASRYDEARPIGGGERPERGERDRSERPERSRERGERGGERAERGRRRRRPRRRRRRARRRRRRRARRGRSAGGGNRRRDRERERERAAGGAGGGGGGGGESNSRERSRDRERKRRSRSRDRKREGEERGKGADGGEEVGAGVAEGAAEEGAERAPEEGEEGGEGPDERSRERDRGDRERDRRRSHRDKGDRDRDRERRRGDRDRDREHKRDRGDRERGGPERREDRHSSMLSRDEMGPQEEVGNGAEEGEAPPPMEEYSQDGMERESMQSGEGYGSNENGFKMEPQGEEY
ncbi:LOW QUALITY PROTEIN: U1 small nuclear ribonucleoprotein 70 kDa [Gadus chalcogrammus]|uniref:LOW QUALITY PROTEIN: U1 small nuclear ribonucleoprotein 70 kDa n=1 Tax=Gadus chalcogrammus TaxID=1042646 RepID=UPI0024C3872D|nr:LOW QUALITY PROTEIN: U1 small nuclear ribonucleoprotein 70 kDa [Gadus chalcogrammus]